MTDVVRVLTASSTAMDAPPKQFSDTHSEYLRHNANGEVPDSVAMANALRPLFIEEVDAAQGEGGQRRHPSASRST